MEQKLDCACARAPVKSTPTRASSISCCCPPPGGQTNAGFTSGGSGACTPPASTCTAARMDGRSPGFGWQHARASLTARSPSAGSNAPSSAASAASDALPSP